MLRALNSFGARAGLLLALFIGGSADAALAPQYYLRARQLAANHLQISVSNVALRAGDCMVSGAVARVFRGNLQPGEPVTFFVRCHKPGLRVSPGAEPSFDAVDLSGARVIEGFFNGDGPEISAALGQLSRVDSVRDRPWCSTTSRTCDLQ